MPYMRYILTNDDIPFILHVLVAYLVDIYVPLNAVIGIYARENGQGLFFDPSQYDNHTQVSKML